ncbi:MAG TPA: zf-HC2 domain-containing protein [Gemmatimonadaceae bacterium]|nr:zf-HC2 domain-containing protein [Gemmatimonadaceae bacterium]
MSATSAQTPHVSSEVLAGYLARTLSSADREEVERHLATCETCRGELIDAQNVLSKRKRPRRAGAAIAILSAGAAIVLLVRLPQSTNRVPGETVLRGGAQSSVNIVAPTEGSIVGDSAVAFQWSGTGGDRLYRISLLDNQANRIWGTETKDTVVNLPTAIHLKPNTEYVWYVESIGLGADSLSSGPVTFKVR